MEALSPEELNTLRTLGRFVEHEDYYSLLGVPQNFSSSELKQAYYNLSRNYHPDRFYKRNIDGHEKLVEGVFSGINRGYQILSSHEERARYDTRRRQRAAKEERSRPPAAEKQTSEKSPSAPRRLSPHVQRLRRQLAARLARARQYFQSAERHIQDEQWIKAANDLYLARQYHPKNETYKALYDEVKPKANSIRARQYIALAETAENYANWTEAIANYQNAVDCEPSEGIAYFRLAEAQRRHNNNPRSALSFYRKAVQQEPESVKYRLGLASMYAELGMRVNAKREYQTILDKEPKNSEARQGLRKL